jgi:uncharacterized protein (TIGR02300 family)
VIREPASLIQGLQTVAKPELGTKRVCPACGTKYYDLMRTPITCPNCGTIYELTARERASPVRAVAAVRKEEDVEDEELETEADVVSLEEVESEDADLADDDEGSSDTVIPDEEVLEVEDDVETDDDTFLAEEEEGGDDVADLLDVDQEGEDEV